VALEENSARSEQDARRSTRWFSRADKRRQEVPNPLEDQDAFDAFVGSLQAKIHDQLERVLDNQVQLEIAHLTRLLGIMPRASIYKNRVFFEIAFDMLAAEQPNIVLVTQLRQALSAAFERSAGVGRFIARAFAKTAIQAVVCGICSTFLLTLLVIVLLSEAHATLQTLDSSLEHVRPIAQLIERMPIAQIIVLVIAAFTGAVVSVLARFPYFRDLAHTAPISVYLTVVAKPFVSIAFASFVYAVVACGLVTLPGVDLAGSSGNAIVWVVGFLSGFSERFVQDFITEADRIATTEPSTVANGAAAPKTPKA
jgi:hypothetical protein